MKPLIYLAFVVTLSVQLFGQTTAASDSTIVWDSDTQCSPANSEGIKAGRPTCERVDFNGGTFYVISFKGISVAISSVFPVSYIRTHMQITNRSGSAINFDPSQSQIGVFANRSDFLDAKNKILSSKNLTAEQARALYLDHQAHLKTYTPGLGVGAMPPDSGPRIKTETKSYHSTNGKTTEVKNGVPIVPDTSPAPPISSARQKSSTKPDSAENSALELYDHGLNTTVLPDQQKTAGYIFFELVTVPVRYLVFRIKVGDWTFVFPEEVPGTSKRSRK